MRKLFFLISLFCLLIVSQPVLSTPLLQLDISDGTYVGDSENSVFATTQQFTLSGLLNSDSGQYGNNGNKVDIDDTFYISVALVDESNSGYLDPVEFSFDGQTVNVNDLSTMTIGRPDGMQKHSIYDTYYWEYEFQFDSNDKATDYNVENDPGSLNPNSNGDLFYASFLVDTANLSSNYSLHFDLYSKKNDGSVNKINPFSHDAQSLPGGGGGTPPDPPAVPEPATLVLLGLGFLSFAVVFRKKIKKC
ncbi:putative PEP-CTERM protein-sorting domain-containing protein [Candidatus Magnetomoraceae bacterium gMMP-15]